MAITKQREREIIWSNRILATLVVVLAVTCGYLWSERNGWFNLEEPESTTSANTLEVRKFTGNVIELPPQQSTSLFGISNDLFNNIAVRTFNSESITIDQLSGLVFAAQGKIAPWGDRTSPSYKSVYPVQVSVIVQNVDQLADGSYYYDPETHTLLLVEDKRTLDPMMTDQPSLQSAGVILVLSADMQAHRIAIGKNRPEIIWSEAGQIAENVLLQAQSLGLGGVVVFDFDQHEISELARMPANEAILMVIPLGIADDGQAFTGSEDTLTSDGNKVQ